MVRSIRRVVAGNDDRGLSVALSDGPSPDVLLDPARPGFASTRLWVTDTTPAPAKGIRESLHLPHRIAPPPNGSLFRVVEYPPEAAYIDRITAADARTYFVDAGAPDLAASGGRHPYMERTPSVDFCFILDGEVTLILDLAEVSLREGDSVIQRGARHAWSNRSDRPCLMAMTQFHANPARSDNVPPVADDAKAQPSVPVRPLRRVVTGHDMQGRSCVIYDSAVPNYFPRATGKCFYELWTLDAVPAALLGGTDAGTAGLPFRHSPPPTGAHWRITNAPADRIQTPTDQDKTKRDEAANRTGGTERREGGRHPGMHRTPSLDYGVCLEGERILVLEDSDILLRKGDTVVQLGGWHSWDERPGVATMNSVVMIGGEFAS